MSVPGRVAKHTWTDASGRTLTLNDHAIPLGLTARYWLTKPIGGLHAGPDYEISAERRKSRVGEIHRHSSPGGKTLTYEGEIEASTYTALEAGRTEFLRAFHVGVSGGMVIVPGSGHPGPSYSCEGTVIAREAPDQLLSHTPYRGPFTLGIRLEDPRYFETTEQSLETGALTSHSGLTLPWSFTTETTGWSTDSRTVSVAYEGDADGDPVLELYGPVTAPRVANELTKTGLRFRDDLVLADGQFIRIDFATREVLLQGLIEYDFDHYRRGELSDWWDVGVPGLVPDATQVLRYGGKTSPGRMVVRFKNATYG